MRRFQLQRFLQPPRLKRSDIWLTLIPALLWLAAPQLRSRLIETHCASHPESCTPASVLAMDRFSLGMNSSRADQFSYYTQNLSGIFGAGVPSVLAVVSMGALEPEAAAIQAGADFVIWFQTVSWNGFINETARLIAQRPRPFVYSDPAVWGANPQNYTSFYSGHTSFSAASCMALFLILLARTTSLPLRLAAGVGGTALIAATAYFRVLAGRHFFSDVIVGALAGIFVALAVSYLHKKDSGSPLA